MAWNKPIILYLALIFILSFNLTHFSGHGQLLPVINDQGGNPGQRQTYIVHVASPEESELLGDEDLESYYKSFLPNTTLDSGASRLVYSYRHVISGFAARLTHGEVQAMEGVDGFLYAYPDELYHLETTYTHEFLGLSQPFHGAWAGTMLGAGVIIGVIDSGITVNHPSFSDHQMPPPPSKWKGRCYYVPCNNKVIGARGFFNGTSPSPKDTGGHGTHVASIAAGNFVNDSDVLGMARGRASGMAPKAHLAIYKVCFKDGCRSSDTLAAIDQAIKDGVDVISMSLSGRHNATLYQDAVAKGSLAAFKNGISPCASAGNAGPGTNSLSHSAPWVMTVGASSTDRRIQAIVKLGNGMEFLGESAFQPSSFNSSYFLPLAYPGKDGVPKAMYCLNGSLDNIDVRGKIVLCWSGGKIDNIKKGEVVYAAGGAAMIIMSQQGHTTDSAAHVLPAAHVSFADGLKIRNYFLSNSTPTHTATIKFSHTQFGFRPAPAVATSSSRGPSEMNGDILKPDVLAPGVNVLAAWPYGVGPHPSPSATKNFNFLSGTSMAAPHVSGIIALLKYKYKQWSPAAIQSAIITSAKDLDLDGKAIRDEATNTTAKVYATGAGQVNPGGALDPGLIYDLTHNDYISYLCGLGYNNSEVYWTIGQHVTCSNRTISPSQLNYPSIAVSLNSTSSVQIVKRTVTNVGGATEVYNASIRAPPGVNVSLSTNQLRFSRVQQDKSFDVTLTLKKSPGKGLVARGKLEWISAKHVVASPIAVRFS